MIEDIVADFRRLATLDAAIAKAAAPRLEAIAKKTAAAGTTPDGEAWKPRKKDGQRPLEHAASRVRTESDRNFVTIVVEGPEYWHQTAKPDGRHPQRKVIPELGDELPAAMADELDKVTQEVLADSMRGGR